VFILGELLLHIDEADLNLDELPEDIFQVDEMKDECRLLLNSYSDINVDTVNTVFDEDKWIFRNNISDYQIIIKFDDINSFFKFNKNRISADIEIAVKCWVAYQLQERAPETARVNLNYLKTLFYMTYGLDESRIADLEENLRNGFLSIYPNKEGRTEKGKIVKQFINASLNFLRFYGDDKYQNIIYTLSEVNSCIKSEISLRSIPSTKDVFLFSDILEDWYRNKLHYHTLLFYPVLIWWNLTTLLPMRISEFCLIQRNCLSYKDDRPFISIPRIKKKRVGKAREEITWDSLPIKKELHSLIFEYIKLTEMHLNTNRLICRTSIEEHLSVKNEESKDFTRTDMRKILSLFYEKIIFENHKINVNTSGYDSKEFRGKSLINASYDSTKIVERMLRANDTRTLSIINLMMQGKDRVEIARLAGHFDIASQYSYQNHLKHWVDSEVFRLAENFNVQDGEISSDKTLYFLDRVYEESWLNYESNSIPQNIIPLKIGFCKDESMPCPSASVRRNYCFFCKHWGITVNQLEEKRELIKEELNVVYGSLMSNINFLVSLHNLNELNDYGEFNQEYKSNLQLNVEKVKNGIRQAARLKVLLGVESNGNQ
jgi:hypothetical protein